MADPDPDWSFDTLLEEIKSLELKLSSSSPSPIPFTKSQSREISRERCVEKTRKVFCMRVSEEELVSTDSDDEGYDKALVTSTRFGCADIYLSDSDNEDGLALHGQSLLMDKVGLEEGALLELTHDHDLEVKEDVRSQVTALEIELLNEYENCSSALIQIQKYRDAKRELDRRFDTQFNRKMAAVLDDHLTTIQRDHVQKSQMEERKIRSEAAFEEAKRKEKALQLEKLKQEKAKAEEEEKRKVAEEARLAALEAEQKAAKEAAEKEANMKRLTSENAKGQANSQLKGEGPNGPGKATSTGNLVKAAERSIKFEKSRLRKFEELNEMNSRLKMSSQQDFKSQDRKILRLLKQLNGTFDSVRSKSDEFISILKDPQIPPSVSLASFAEKVVSQCNRPGTSAFATGHVIVHVTSKVPQAMDIILAEFHKTCIYTVPKHISFSKAVFDSKESYHKAIGFQEVDGKLEDGEDFLKRVESCMKLYAALVQTEVQGVRNPHGLEAGWIWLSTFLNSLPANVYTAVALDTFLKVAGFALYKKFKKQFIKLLEVIHQDFLRALKERKEPGTGSYITSIQSYIMDMVFLQEPEGWRLQGKLLSTDMVPQGDDQPRHGQQQQQQYGYQQPYGQQHYSSNRFYQY